MRTPTHPTRNPRRGFTIIEMLIAVGAIGLIALGLSRLFAATGKAVSDGKRLSALNEVAMRAERIMREDFARATRRGPMVIRNREVGGTGPPPTFGVLLNPDDRRPNTTRRRVDQVLFFEEGRFTSMREPIHPSRSATGAAAMVLYGHGLRQDPRLAGYYAPVNIDDTNDDPSFSPSFGVSGPNEYAADWILTRRVTVLSPPQPTTSIDAPAPASGSPTITWPGNDRWGDSENQIGLQPASPTVFRRVNELSDKYRQDFTVRGQSALPRSPAPLLSSGIVDIAATDLSAVRQRILSAIDPALNPTARLPKLPRLEVRPTSSNMVAFASPSTGPINPVVFTVDNPDQMHLPGSTTSRMKEWMLQAFPTEVYPASDPNRERRVRCEPTPPDLTGTIATGTPYPPEETFRRTDQAMLSGSNFVVGCTEFIVEWSFGATYPTNYAVPALAGQLIWHGLERPADLNGDGVIGPGEYAAIPYASDRPEQAMVFRPRDNDAYLRAVERENIRTNGNAQPPYKQHVFSTALIHIPPVLANTNPPTTGLGQDEPFFSCFGYVDPSFGYRANQGTSAADPAIPDTAPCPWPKLIRVTMSLVDSNDPGTEQTYQFIFTIPAATDEGGV